MARSSTPKYEVVSLKAWPLVLLTGVSKTEARQFARAMGAKDFLVRPVRRA
jgi:FixJ family two-component response regulator